MTVATRKGLRSEVVPEQTEMIELTPRIVDGGDVGVAGRRVRVIYDRYQLTYQLTASLIWWPHSQPLGEYLSHGAGGNDGTNHRLGVEVSVRVPPTEISATAWWLAVVIWLGG